MKNPFEIIAKLFWNQFYWDKRTAVRQYADSFNNTKNTNTNTKGGKK